MSVWGELALFLAAGAALGMAYMAVLARSVAALVEDGGTGAAVLLTVTRIAVAVAAFWAAALAGAGPLLTMLAGFLLARSAVLRRSAR